MILRLWRTSEVSPRRQFADRGNYASGYYWRDGIGPIDERPTRPNRAWGGVDQNHVGTDEWLRFTKLAGIEPVMGVGFGELDAEEAADWVEYCNGDPSSPMGALRAGEWPCRTVQRKVLGHRQRSLWELSDRTY